MALARHEHVCPLQFLDQLHLMPWWQIKVGHATLTVQMAHAAGAMCDVCRCLYLVLWRRSAQRFGMTVMGNVRSGLL